MTRTRQRSPEAVQAIAMRQSQQTTSAAKVAVASEAKTSSDALTAAVPSGLAGTLADYEVRLQNLENP